MEERVANALIRARAEGGDFWIGRLLCRRTQDTHPHTGHGSALPTRAQLQLQFPDSPREGANAPAFAARRPLAAFLTRAGALLALSRRGRQ